MKYVLFCNNFCFSFNWDNTRRARSFFRIFFAYTRIMATFSQAGCFCFANESNDKRNVKRIFVSFNSIFHIDNAIIIKNAPIFNTFRLMFYGFFSYSYKDINFYNKTRELCEKIFSHIGVMKVSLEKKASATIVPDMLCILSFLLIRQLYIQTHENVIYISANGLICLHFFRHLYGLFISV